MKKISLKLNAVEFLKDVHLRLAAARHSHILMNGYLQLS